MCICGVMFAALICVKSLVTVLLVAQVKHLVSLHDEPVFCVKLLAKINFTTGFYIQWLLLLYFGNIFICISQFTLQCFDTVG